MPCFTPQMPPVHPIAARLPVPHHAHGDEAHTHIRVPSHAWSCCPLCRLTRLLFLFLFAWHVQLAEQATVHVVSGVGCWTSEDAPLPALPPSAGVPCVLHVGGQVDVRGAAAAGVLAVFSAAVAAEGSDYGSLDAVEAAVRRVREDVAAAYVAWKVFCFRRVG